MATRLTRAQIQAACAAPEQDRPRKRGLGNKSRPLRAPKEHESQLPVVRVSDSGKPVKIWTTHLDSMAWRQANAFASLPFVHPEGMALMPDVHPGRDVCVGSVLPTVGAIVPAAVGTDVGCGMMAVRLSLMAHQLPDSLRALRKSMEASIPLGAGQIHRVPPEQAKNIWEVIRPGYEQVGCVNTRACLPDPARHLGTLGGGNHFIEVCLDEKSGVWIVVHTGSRGPGATLAQWFINQAHRRVREAGQAHGSMGWFPEEDPLFKPYTDAIAWSQEFARLNREVIMEVAIQALAEAIGWRPEVQGKAINCHHNYVAQEQHFGIPTWVTRKGAISAMAGEWGIVPGSMGDRTYIVKGRGSQASFHSCAHGAGRRMSRKSARDRYTVKDLKQATRGVECKVSRTRVDEIPLAYKPIKQVMQHQSDLVEPIFELKQVVCLKGD